MSLVNAPLCTHCGIRHTKHKSGLCCDCRRKTEPLRPCIICGQVNTSSDDGICSHCRRKSASKNYGLNMIDAAIDYYETALLILRKRREMKTFQEISEELGLPKTTVYSMFTFSLNSSKTPYSEKLSSKFADPKIDNSGSKASSSTSPRDILLSGTELTNELVPAVTDEQERSDSDAVKQGQSSEASGNAKDNAALASSDPKVFVQFKGSEIDTDVLYGMVRAMFSSARKGEEISDIQLYIKPDEKIVYYVVNDEFKGSIGL